MSRAKIRDSLVLMAIGLHGQHTETESGITNRHLSKTEILKACRGRLHKPQIAASCAFLESIGAVENYRDPSDSKRQLITLTNQMENVFFGLQRTVEYIFGPQASDRWEKLENTFQNIVFSNYSRGLSKLTKSMTGSMGAIEASKKTGTEESFFTTREISWFVQSLQQFNPSCEELCQLNLAVSAKLTLCKKNVNSESQLFHGLSSKIENFDPKKVSIYPKVPVTIYYILCSFFMNIFHFQKTKYQHVFLNEKFPLDFSIPEPKILETNDLAQNKIQKILSQMIHQGLSFEKIHLFPQNELLESFVRFPEASCSVLKSSVVQTMGKILPKHSDPELVSVILPEIIAGVFMSTTQGIYLSPERTVTPKELTVLEKERIDLLKKEKRKIAKFRSVGIKEGALDEINWTEEALGKPPANFGKKNWQNHQVFADHNMHPYYWHMERDDRDTAFTNAYRKLFIQYADAPYHPLNILTRDEFQPVSKYRRYFRCGRIFADTLSAAYEDWLAPLFIHYVPGVGSKKSGKCSKYPLPDKCYGKLAEAAYLEWYRELLTMHSVVKRDSLAASCPELLPENFEGTDIQERFVQWLFIAIQATERVSKIPSDLTIQQYILAGVLSKEIAENPAYNFVCKYEHRDFLAGRRQR